jgi:hypothetical protein
MSDRTTVTDLVHRLPYPLSYNLNRLLAEAARRDDGESIPLFAYSICSLNSLLVRLVAAIAIQSYVRIAGAKDTTINQEVINALREPTDGKWLEIARLTTNALADRTDTPLASRLRNALTKKQSKVTLGARPVANALENLIAFRNQLIHGERLAEEKIDRALQMVLQVVVVLGFLGEYELLIRQGSKGFRLAGLRPEPITEVPPDLPEGEPCLVRRSGGEAPLSLSPLLVFHEQTPDGVVGFDELFFLNAGAAERLNYIAFHYARQMDGRTLGSYAAFRKYVQGIPAPAMPPESKIDFSSVVSDHTRLFVGREDVLDEIAQFVATRPVPYGVVTALAGMGKTAVFARLFEARPGGAANIWAFHFCMPTDGRNSPTVALRSLTSQVCEACGLDRGHYLSSDVDEMREHFGRALTDASVRLPECARIVVVIDALDEGIVAGAKESVASVLPDEVPANILFLVSYRVDPSGRNARVEGELKHLPPSNRHPLPGANPLAGLTRANAAAFLDRLAKATALPAHTKAGAVPARTVEHVWNVASRDGNGADPFYLRFIADGIESGRMDMERAETIPESLDDAFDEFWMALPTDRDFLVHRILGMLAVMHDYGDDEMFAYLFGKDLPRDADPLTAVDVAALRAKAGKVLVYDGDRYGLVHDRFRQFLVGERHGLGVQPATERVT